MGLADLLGIADLHCRPALPKGRKYQMVKTQTQSHVRRPVGCLIVTKLGEFSSLNKPIAYLGFLFPLSFSEGRLEFVTQAFGDSLKLSSTGLAIQ